MNIKNIVVMPCPFCDFDDPEVCEVEPGTFAIDCPNCQCIGPYADDIENAVRCWNIPHDRDYKMDRLVQEAKVGDEKTSTYEISKANCLLQAHGGID
jgi:hypothetical protein